MEFIDKHGVVWHQCNHLTNGTRRWYRFRMVGKKFYCTPKNLRKPTYTDKLDFYQKADLAEAEFCRKLGYHESVTQLNAWATL